MTDTVTPSVNQKHPNNNYFRFLNGSLAQRLLIRHKKEPGFRVSRKIWSQFHMAEESIPKLSQIWFSFKTSNAPDL